MNETSGVLIVREDGATVVDDAIPVTRGLVDAIEQLLDHLGAPKRRETERKEPD